MAQYFAHSFKTVKVDVMTTRKLLPILMLMVVLSPLAIDIYLPAMPDMASAFSVSTAQVQSTLVLFILAMGMGQILIGPLADRFGRRPIALLAITLYIASSWFAAVVVDFHHLQIARVLQGIAACGISIVVFSAVRDCFDSQKSAHYYSYLNGVICIVPALAPTLGGFLSLQFGWRATFVFMMLFAILVLAVVLLTLPETRPQNTQNGGRLYRWGRYQPVLAHTQFLFYGTLCLTSMAGIITYVSYAPSWVITHLGVSQVNFSYLFGFNALINIAACFIAPKVIKRMGDRSTILMALGIMLLSSMLQLLLQQWSTQDALLNAAFFMLPMLLLGVGFALILGPATSLALAPFAQRAGTASALLGCFQMAGSAILVGLIQQTELTAPYASVIMIGGGSCLLLITLLLPRCRHWHQPVAL